MRNLVCLAVVCVAVAATSAVSLLAQATERSLYVSVLDREGTPVTQLGPEVFVVREDGRSREVLRVAPATEPIDLAILVDNSQAATPHISDLRKALEAFVKRMAAGGHAVALIGLADRPTILQDYTNNPTLLQRGVERIFAQPGSGMRLLDAIVETVNGLRRRENPRRAIVTITTEGIEFSNPNHTRVLESLRGSGAMMFSLVLTTGRGPDLTDEARSRGIVLDEGTGATGGRQEKLLTSMALEDELGRVARELEHQLHVVYARPDALVPPERVEVSVTRADLTARGTATAAPPSRPGGGN
jgi:VWFA-related protein